MDDQRVGRVVRALRHRLGWRQSDLGRAAECSQTVISSLERGHLSSLSVRLLRRIFAALDASVLIEIRWRGAAVDRLMDDADAALVAAVAEYLRRDGWLVETEITYSEFGERGSFDLLAFHPRARIVVAIEVKTDLPSAEATLRKLDEKARLATIVARKRCGWEADQAGRLLVFPASQTLHRRVARHAGLFERALPTRNVATRQWLRRPSGPVAGLWFFSDRDPGTHIAAIRRRERVRCPKSVRTKPANAA
jgi:transcriptional regulator with XRE-family HTH domain